MLQKVHWRTGGAYPLVLPLAVTWLDSLPSVPTTGLHNCTLLTGKGLYPAHYTGLIASIADGVLGLMGSSARLLPSGGNHFAFLRVYLF